MKSRKQLQQAALKKRRRPSVDAAVATVSQNSTAFFKLKEDQRMALKGCHGGKHVFALLLTGFCKSLAKHQPTK